MIAGGAALVGAAPDVPDLDGMDWDAGGIIEAGSAKQEEAELDIVRAAVELAGGGEQREDESGVEYL